MRRDLFEDLHEDFRASFRTFLEREVIGEQGRYGEWEREGLMPREVFAAAGLGGFLAMAVPEAHGGAGAEDFRLNLVIGEETQCAGVGSFGLGITLHNDICLPYFLSYCNDEQRERWLGGIASGELITAIAMTEPGIGSDLASMSTRAIRDGDHYVVNGSKTFITNGINGDLVITAVKTDPAQRHRGISLLIVERGMDRRSASTPRTPPSCPSQTCACRWRTCSARRARAFAISCQTCHKSACRSPPRRSRRPRLRWSGRCSTCASARRSVSRSAHFRAHDSRWPRRTAKCRSHARSSTAARRRWTPAS
jgi:alkylation response protein AidB-like acyl-CoA dehydrogenase